MCRVGLWKGCVFGGEEGEGLKWMEVGSTGRMVVVNVEPGAPSEGAGGGVERVMAPVLLLVTAVRRRNGRRRRSWRWKRVPVDRRSVVAAVGGCTGGGSPGGGSPGPGGGSPGGGRIHVPKRLL